MRNTALGFIAILSLAILAAPLAADAQQAGRMYRLGILQPTPWRAPADPTTLTNQIVTALGPLGYVEGVRELLEAAERGAQ